MYFFLARAFARAKKKYIAPFGATYLTYVSIFNLDKQYYATGSVRYNIKNILPIHVRTGTGTGTYRVQSYVRL